MPAVPSPSDSSRSTTTTFAPPLAKPSEVARPMPPPPPITIATLPVKSIASLPLVVLRPMLASYAATQSPLGGNHAEDPAGRQSAQRHADRAGHGALGLRPDDRPAGQRRIQRRVGRGGVFRR